MVVALLKPAAAGLIVLVHQAFATAAAHQSQHHTITTCLLTNTTLSSTPRGSGGDSVPVTCGLYPTGDRKPLI